MKKKLQFLLGLALTVFLLWFLFRDTDWHKLLLAIRETQLIWLFAALFFVLLSFVTRILRWSYIVRTAKPASFRSMFSATQIGFLVNLLPLRAGEFVRALVLGMLEKLPFTKCFAFVALDRITDIFGLLAVMLITVTAYHPEQDIVLEQPWEVTIPADIITTSAMLAGMGLLLLLVMLVFLYLKQDFVVRITGGVTRIISPKLADKLCAMLQHFAEGLHIFRSVGDMLKSIVFSLMTWGCFTLSYWMLFWSFGIDVPWYAPFLTVTLVAAAVSIPVLPGGGVGAVHMAIAVALLITTDTLPDTAKAVAIVGHLMNIGPVIVVGVACLYLENMGLLTLRHARENLEQGSTTGEQGHG